MRKYIDLFISYGEAWDNGNIDAILSHFAEDFIYTDLLRPKGVTNKLDLQKYLTEVFTRFPKQTWTTNPKIYSYKDSSQFAIFYEFKLESKNQVLTGTGMEKVTFLEDKIIEDRIHLLFNEIDGHSMLGFK